MRKPHTPIIRLKNLGPTSARQLADVGIHTLGDLEEMGSVFAYRVLKHRFSSVSLLMLYALDAAIRDIPWFSLTEDDKNKLRQEAESDFDVVQSSKV